MGTRITEIRKRIRPRLTALQAAERRLASVIRVYHAHRTVAADNPGNEQLADAVDDLGAAIYGDAVP